MTIAKTIFEKKQDMGNNEGIILKGLYTTTDGEFFALTATRSKLYKTEKAARKFLGL